MDWISIWKMRKIPSLILCQWRRRLQARPWKGNRSYSWSAQKLIDKNGWLHHQEDLYHSYLDFYRHYNRFEDHEKSSRLLVAYYKKAVQDPKLKLKVELKDDAIEKMRSLAGFLQIKLAKDMKKDESHYKDKELNLVLNFFNHLIQLDPTRKVEYFYFRAETYYSVRRFNDAAPSYVETVVEAKVSKNEEHARKASIHFWHLPD